MIDHNPYAVSDGANDHSGIFAEKREYGGIGRLSFAVSLPLVYFSTAVVTIALRTLGYRATAVMIMPASSLLYLLLAVQRVRNTGFSGRWLLALFLPFLTPFILLGLFAAPEGYADHGKFDTAGIVVIGLMILGFVLLVAMLLLVALTTF
jgi:hypothetical protein